MFITSSFWEVHQEFMLGIFYFSNIGAQITGNTCLKTFLRWNCQVRETFPDCWENLMDKTAALISEAKSV